MLHFDFFILSDSTDTNAWIAEELAWDLSRRRLGANGRLEGFDDKYYYDYITTLSTIVVIVVVII